MPHDFIKQGFRKVWKRADGVIIWLPCDKRTFRIVNSDFDQIDARKFRTFEAAVRAAA